jgi:hypothetical protein
VTDPALRQGDFVWCAFPEREAPLRPGPIHVAYTLAVAGVAGGFGVMVAYTTSQSWAGALPQGVIAFDSKAAVSLGQTRAFVLDLRRLAYLPLTASWFPRVGEENAGVLGRAPKALRDRLNVLMTEVETRRPETLSRSGPLWETTF